MSSLAYVLYKLPILLKSFAHVSLKSWVWRRHHGETLIPRQPPEWHWSETYSYALDQPLELILDIDQYFGFV